MNEWYAASFRRPCDAEREKQRSHSYELSIVNNPPRLRTRYHQRCPPGTAFERPRGSVPRHQSEQRTPASAPGTETSFFVNHGSKKWHTRLGVANAVMLRVSAKRLRVSMALASRLRLRGQEEQVKYLGYSYQPNGVLRLPAAESAHAKIRKHA